MSGLVWFLLIYYGGRALWRRYKNNPHLTQALPVPALRILTLLRRPLALYHTYYAIILMALGAGFLLGALALVIGGVASTSIGAVAGGGISFLLGRWLWRLGQRIGREELAVLRGQETRAADATAMPSTTHPLPAHTALPKHTPPPVAAPSHAKGTRSAARAPQSPTLHKKKQDKQFEQL